MINYGFIKDIDAAANFKKVEDFLRQEYGVKDILSLKQVHGDKILVDESGEADGIIVTKDNCAGVVRTADCFPVVLFDRKKDVGGVFHCGWRGTELGIHKKGKSKMSALGVIMHKLLRIAYGVLKTGIPYSAEIDKKNRADKKPVQNNEEIQERTVRRLQNYEKTAPISKHADKKRRQSVSHSFEAKIFAGSKTAKNENIENLITVNFGDKNETIST